MRWMNSWGRGLNRSAVSRSGSLCAEVGTGRADPERTASQHFAQAAFQHLLIRALAAAFEPALELADTDGVLGLELLDGWLAEQHHSNDS